MLGFLRNWPGRVEFQVPQAELAAATVTQRLAELQSRYDAALRLLDQLTQEACCAGTCDALLEVRHVLRPSVPVIPGRS